MAVSKRIKRVIVSQTAKKKTAQSSLNGLTPELVGVNLNDLFTFVRAALLTHGVREHFTATFGAGSERWGSKRIV